MNRQTTDCVGRYRRGLLDKIQFLEEYVERHFLGSELFYDILLDLLPCLALFLVVRKSFACLTGESPFLEIKPLKCLLDEEREIELLSQRLLHFAEEHAGLGLNFLSAERSLDKRLEVVAPVCLTKGGEV